MTSSRRLPERLSGVPRWIGFFVLAATTIVAAQVPLSKEPRHRVTFENKQLRILDVNIPAGDTSLDHRHDLDIVTVSMTSGTNTRIQTGKEPATDRPPRPLGDATVAEYAGKSGSHKVENVGKTAYQLFAVENLRTSGWSTAPAASGLATKMTREARSFRLYDVNLSRDTSQTSHKHDVPTIAVLISGSVMSDGPDTQAKANPGAPVGLKQLTQPGQWILVPPGDTHHVVRLGAGNARVVEIEVR
jgi:quercetin dioxygenase-like cupin family protein